MNKLKHPSQPTSSLNLYWLIVIGCLLVMFFVAVPLTNADAPWLDESYTFQFAGLERIDNLNVFQSIGLVALFDSWPPLYYIFQNIWSDFTGQTLFAINLLPTMFGLISVSATYRIGKMMFKSERGGIIASALLAFSSFPFYYLHETRGYSLYLLVWILFTLAYWQLVSTNRQNTKSYQRILTLASICVLYAHYISIVIFGAVGAYHLLFEYREATRHPNMTRQRWIETTRAAFNGFLFYAPWLAVFYLIIVSISWSGSFTPFTEIMATLIQASTNNLWLVGVPLAFLSLAKIKERSTRFLWFWMSLLLLGFFLMNWLFQYLFHPRHIFPLVFLLILLITQGILVLDRFSQWIGTIFVAAWVVAGIWFVVTDTDLGYQPYVVSLETMNQLDIAHQQCFSDDDVVVLSLADNRNDPRDEEFVMGALTVYYYAGASYARYPLIDLVNTDTVFTDTPNRPPFDDFGEVETFDKIATASEEGATIYLFSATNLDNQSEIQEFNRVVQGQGYQQCPMLWEHDALRGWVYTMDDNCEQLLTCAP